jgi:hypothetical protein
MPLMLRRFDFLVNYEYMIFTPRHAFVIENATSLCIQLYSR